MSSCDIRGASTHETSRISQELIRATALLAIQYRRACQPKMPEQIHQRREALLAPGIDVLAGVIEKTGAAAHADAALGHIARDHLRRAIALAMQRAFQI